MIFKINKILTDSDIKNTYESIIWAICRKSKHIVVVNNKNRFSANLKDWKNLNNIEIFLFFRAKQIMLNKYYKLTNQNSKISRISWNTIIGPELHNNKSKPINNLIFKKNFYLYKTNLPAYKRVYQENIINYFQQIIADTYLNKWRQYNIILKYANMRTNTIKYYKNYYINFNILKLIFQYSFLITTKIFAKKIFILFFFNTLELANNTSNIFYKLIKNTQNNQATWKQKYFLNQYVINNDKHSTKLTKKKIENINYKWLLLSFGNIFITYRKQQHLKHIRNRKNNNIHKNILWDRIEFIRFSKNYQLSFIKSFKYIILKHYYVHHNYYIFYYKHKNKYTTGYININNKLMHQFGQLILQVKIIFKESCYNTSSITAIHIVINKYKNNIKRISKTEQLGRYCLFNMLTPITNITSLLRLNSKQDKISKQTDFFFYKNFVLARTLQYWIYLYNYQQNRQNVTLEQYTNKKTLYTQKTTINYSIQFNYTLNNILKTIPFIQNSQYLNSYTTYNTKIYFIYFYTHYKSIIYTKNSNTWSIINKENKYNKNILNKRCYKFKMCQLSYNKYLIFINILFKQPRIFLMAVLTSFKYFQNQYININTKKIIGYYWQIIKLNEFQKKIINLTTAEQNQLSFTIMLSIQNKTSTNKTILCFYNKLPDINVTSKKLIEILYLFTRINHTTNLNEDRFILHKTWQQNNNNQINVFDSYYLNKNQLKVTTTTEFKYNNKIKDLTYGNSIKYLIYKMYYFSFFNFPHEKNLYFRFIIMYIHNLKLAISNKPIITGVSKMKLWFKIFFYNKSHLIHKFKLINKPIHAQVFIKQWRTIKQSSKMFYYKLYYNFIYFNKYKQITYISKICLHNTNFKLLVPFFKTLIVKNAIKNFDNANITINHNNIHISIIFIKRLIQQPQLTKKSNTYIWIKLTYTKIILITYLMFIFNYIINPITSNYKGINYLTCFRKIIHQVMFRLKQKINNSKIIHTQQTNSTGVTDIKHLKQQRIKIAIMAISLKIILPLISYTKNKHTWWKNIVKPFKMPQTIIELSKLWSDIVCFHNVLNQLACTVYYIKHKTICGLVYSSVFSKNNKTKLSKISQYTIVTNKWFNTLYNLVFLKFMFICYKQHNKHNNLNKQYITLIKIISEITHNNKKRFAATNCITALYKYMNIYIVLFAIHKKKHYNNIPAIKAYYQVFKKYYNNNTKLNLQQQYISFILIIDIILFRIKLLWVLHHKYISTWSAYLDLTKWIFVKHQKKNIKQLIYKFSIISKNILNQYKNVVYKSKYLNFNYTIKLYLFLFIKFFTKFLLNIKIHMINAPKQPIKTTLLHLFNTINYINNNTVHLAWQVKKTWKIFNFYLINIIKIIQQNKIQNNTQQITWLLLLQYTVCFDKLINGLTKIFFNFKKKIINDKLILYIKMFKLSLPGKIKHQPLLQAVVISKLCILNNALIKVINTIQLTWVIIIYKLNLIVQTPKNALKYNYKKLFINYTTKKNLHLIQYNLKLFQLKIKLYYNTKNVALIMFRILSIIFLKYNNDKKKISNIQMNQIINYFNHNLYRNTKKYLFIKIKIKFWSTYSIFVKVHKNTKYLIQLKQTKYYTIIYTNCSKLLKKAVNLNYFYENRTIKNKLVNNHKKTIKYSYKTYLISKILKRDRLFFFINMHKRGINWNFKYATKLTILYSLSKITNILIKTNKAKKFKIKTYKIVKKIKNFDKKKCITYKTSKLTLIAKNNSNQINRAFFNTNNIAVLRNTQAFRMIYTFYDKKNKSLKLHWDRKIYKLTKIHHARKSKSMPNMFLIFKPIFKYFLISNILGNLKSFTKFTFFFKVIKNKITNHQKTQKILSLKRVFRRGIYSAPITGIKYFIFQRRNSKEGFSIWKKIVFRWLRLSLFNRKYKRFYFTPLRTKVWIFTKKLKLIQTYQRLFLLYPQPGPWKTIGLVGNRLGRNTTYLKKRILLGVFKTFYGINNQETFKKEVKTNLRIYSKYHGFLSNILSYFEHRLDVIIFRAGFIFSIFLARIVILRGFLRINFYTTNNPHYRTCVGDFIFFNNLKFRASIFDIRYERYSSYKKMILGRFYKPYHFELLSGYLYSLLSSLFQMTTLKVWLMDQSFMHTFFNEYLITFPSATKKELYSLRLNEAITTLNQFEEEIDLNLKKPIYWGWCRKENILISNFYKKGIMACSFFKLETFKNTYTLSLITLLKKRNQLKIAHSKNNKNKFNFIIWIGIIKDLLRHTWEKYSKNIFVNNRYPFLFVFGKIQIDTIKRTDYQFQTGQVTIRYFNWLIKTIKR